MMGLPASTATPFPCQLLLNPKPLPRPWNWPEHTRRFQHQLDTGTLCSADSIGCATKTPMKVSATLWQKQQPPFGRTNPPPVLKQDTAGTNVPHIIAAASKQAGESLDQRAYVQHCGSHVWHLLLGPCAGIHGMLRSQSVDMPRTRSSNTANLHSCNNRFPDSQATDSSQPLD